MKHIIISILFMMVVCGVVGVVIICGMYAHTHEAHNICGLVCRGLSAFAGIGVIAAAFSIVEKHW